MKKERIDALAKIYYQTFGVFRGDEKNGRTDAVFFARELEYVKKKVREKKYPAFLQRTLIPTTFETDSGAETITYYLYDHTGLAKIVSDYAKDFPRASTKRTKFTGDIKSLGASFGYSIQDIRAARMAGVALEQLEANSAYKSIQLREQRIAYYGDTAYNLLGLFNNPNVTNGTVPADGAAGSTAFSQKTADQIIRDVMDVLNTPHTLTNGIEVVDTLLVSPAIYALLASTPRSGTSDTTIMEFILDKHDTLKNIVKLAQCAEPAAGWSSVGLSFTGDIMMAYHRDPDALEFEIPQDFEQMEPEQENMELKVACHERCGGVSFYLPLSANIVDGLTE